MLIVDSHLHVVAPDRQRYPLSPYLGRLGEWVDANPVSAEQLLEQMDAAGVQRGLLIQAATAYGHVNDYVADSLQRYRPRFAGICMIDMLAPDAPLRLTYWVELRGMRGIRLFTTPEPEAPWLDDPRTFGVWERTRELGIPMMVQIYTQHLPRLRTMLERFPEIPVALDHLANAQVMEGATRPSNELLALADLPQVYAKFSTVNFYAIDKAGGSAAEYFGPLLESFGAGRLLWGSNFPNTYDRGYKEMLDLAQTALDFLSADDQAAIFGGTVLSLWPELTARSQQTQSNSTKTANGD
jgi:L-fuconolactonase